MDYKCMNPFEFTLPTKVIFGPGCVSSLVSGADDSLVQDLKAVALPWWIRRKRMLFLELWKRSI